MPFAAPARPGRPEGPARRGSLSHGRGSPEGPRSAVAAGMRSRAGPGPAAPVPGGAAPPDTPGPPRAGTRRPGPASWRLSTAAAPGGGTCSPARAPTPPARPPAGRSPGSRSSPRAGWRLPQPRPRRAGLTAAPLVRPRRGAARPGPGQPEAPTGMDPAAGARRGARVPGSTLLRQRLLLRPRLLRRRLLRLRLLGAPGCGMGMGTGRPRRGAAVLGGRPPHAGRSGRRRWTGGRRLSGGWRWLRAGAAALPLGSNSARAASASLLPASSSAANQRPPQRRSLRRAGQSREPLPAAASQSRAEPAPAEPPPPGPGAGDSRRAWRGPAIPALHPRPGPARSPCLSPAIEWQSRPGPGRAAPTQVGDLAGSPTRRPGPAREAACLPAARPGEDNPHGRSGQGLLGSRRNSQQGRLGCHTPTPRTARGARCPQAGSRPPARRRRGEAEARSPLSGRSDRGEGGGRPLCQPPRSSPSPPAPPRLCQPQGARNPGAGALPLSSHPITPNAPWHSQAQLQILREMHKDC